MKTSLIIAEFEMYYCTSFQHTARVKYGVDFNTSNVDNLGQKLSVLKEKIQKNEGKNIHVGFEITLEHVEHVESLLNQIMDRYKEIFQILPSNRKIYTINQKLREDETPPVKEIAKQVLDEILTPKSPVKLSKAQKLEKDANASSKKRALKLINKNSAKGK